MTFVPSNNQPSSYHAFRQSPSLAPQQTELDDHEAPTLHDVLFPNDFLDEGFAANPLLFLSPQVPPPADLRNVKPFVHSHAIGEPQRTGRFNPHEPQQPTSFGSFPGPVIHPAVISQSPFDGTYSLPNPSMWAGPSYALYGGGDQAALAGGQHMAAAVPSMSGTMPMMMTAPAAAPPFPSSMHVTAPASGSPAGARVPIVRPWDMDAATAAGTFARTAPRPVPTFCRCNRRPHPFVRVDDTIEWVRPDLMKMVVYFNWSLDAEAEAHEPWGPRRE